MAHQRLFQEMDNNNIWFKPKPTHIDEYFEDFLGYLKSSSMTQDALRMESVRLLKERVSLLVSGRAATPLYRQEKSSEAMKFNVRLCGAWLLAVGDAGKQERKLVLLTMINNLVGLAKQSSVTVLNSVPFAYRKVPDLLAMAMRLPACDVPSSMPFMWDDIVNFSLDMFLANRFLKLNLTAHAEICFDGNGFMTTRNGKLLVADYTKDDYDKKYMKSSYSETAFLPEYGVTVSSCKGLLLKESQKDDIAVVEKFVNDFVSSMKSSRHGVAPKRLSHYDDGDLVPVEVTESSSDRIMLKTVDPSFSPVEGCLSLDQNLKIFSKIYTTLAWSKALKVGDRFRARVYVSSGTFSVTEQFVDYIQNNVEVMNGIYDAHNHKSPTAWALKLREFWTASGFLVFVDLTEEEDEELDENDRYAGLEITHFGTGQFRGCIYGRISDYEVETRDISREEVCPRMLRNFIAQYAYTGGKSPEAGQEPVSPDFIKEYCHTLNTLQSREGNPMLRYRLLSFMRMLCTLTAADADDSYCQYMAKYLKALVVFAKADSHEGEAIVPIDAPEGLKDEETVSDGADILRILSCFAKGSDATDSILDQYIESGNATLSQTASLTQSYNRLLGLLEAKTLRGIKKQILKLLSVVVDGESTLELSSELEGVFGEEDDMKEFKTSFFEAPANAREQRQYHNIFRGICAMMNNRGGVLYLGVNDKGIPVGVKADLEKMASQYNMPPTLDSYMLHISRQGEEWFGETCWKYVTLKPVSEYNVVSVIVDPYPYDIVYLKDKTTYIRKNNASAPITDDSTIEDIRRRRLENLRKTDDKVIVLQDAISRERRVRLMGYKSSNSGTVRNRVVEPFYLDGNEYLHCYEPETGDTKLFRVSRADKVVMLEEPWAFRSKHKKLNLDPFHMTGTAKINVKLRLKVQAKNAIEEYYPGISQYISPYNSDTWTLDTFTYNLAPLTVFYLSQARYVEIVEAKGLKESVRDYVNKYLHIE